MSRREYVRSKDGVRLAVYEEGSPRAPTLVAVHGYPDNHGVWDEVTALLADRFHVVSYDVRGCGASDKPSTRSAYQMPRLVDDLRAVLDAVDGGAPAHLLAHDWGSIQGWAAVTDAALADRIATYTSISGPSLDYTAAWLRSMHQHPRAALRQLGHSYYIALFQLPKLPEAAVRLGQLDRTLRRLDTSPAISRSAADKINGLALYRANMFRRLRRPRPFPTLVPVQLIVPKHDPFVTPALATQAPKPWVAELSVRTVEAGHWVMSERPELVAQLTADFIAARTNAR